MSLIASIYNDTTTAPGLAGYVYVTGTIYIKITDENGRPTNGNGIIVTVQRNADGQITNEDYVVPGQNLPIYSGTINRSQNGQVFNSVSYTVVSASPAAAAPPATTCNVVINSVSIIQKESSPGAQNGQITINAYSSYVLLYSLDNINFQSSPTFSNLAGGAYNAYIKDTNGCAASYAFDIGTTQNLLVNDPSVNLGGGNISRWSAAFNPVVFTYQRKDFAVTNIFNSSISSGTQFIVNADTSSIKAGDSVYINAGAYLGVYTVDVPLTNGFVIKNPFMAGSNTIGYINCNTLRSYYKVTTQINFQDQNGATKTIISTNRPDKTGFIRADFSSFLQSLLQPVDNSDYTQVNYRDTSLSASYQLAYRESWTDAAKNEQSSAWVSIGNPFYITYSAKQLGDQHGGNMAAYVPFKTVINPNQLAKWVTDFAEPAYSTGYPFDIGFIYSEDLIGLDLYYEMVMLDANRQPLSGTPGNVLLLNDDSSYLLGQDNSRFIINSYGATQNLTPNQLGLNRLMINAGFPREAYYFNLTLKYKDAGNNPHAVTQTQTVRIDNTVDDQSVYLRWIGLSGAWNYYRFVYNQEVTLDVQNAVIIKNFVSDWENQQGIEEVISKSAGQKMKVMAEDLSVADIKGLQAVKYSPKVQMLINSNPIKWQTVVLNTATFTEYETRYGQYAFSVTFNLPSINIQTQ
ncbi:hypothetical protein [Mucilaginibacter polytrichastri]|uniref:Uncharacterized protein n=1 Tax=Mucilaginibacter polytrichastri TaxID=1302689 RepID=A0A1Q5ZSV1_9SPHI|nr:hypothetical protein [Mucilaginibacter polytrichastri]OKS84850.1 hypothetical protein RG47T_0287 [Mucilaginibacter polytrichastri]SFS48669.1 hypothetical protein SAMN04487890_101787 [Mucilaginibacter polytrichastri]